jgi:hypothetical protein
MGKTMTTLYRRLTALGPEARQYVIGAGLAFNMLPTQVTRTFYRSDYEALRADWRKVAEGLWWAVDKAEQEKQLGAGD